MYVNRGKVKARKQQLAWEELYYNGPVLLANFTVLILSL